MFPPSALFMLATMSAPKDAKSVVLWNTSFRIIASQPEADEIFHVVLLRLELKRVFVAAGFVVEIRINLRHDFEFAAFVGDV